MRRLQRTRQNDVYPKKNSEREAFMRLRRTSMPPKRIPDRQALIRGDFDAYIKTTSFLINKHHIYSTVQWTLAPCATVLIPRPGTIVLTLCCRKYQLPKIVLLRNFKWLSHVSTTRSTDTGIEVGERVGQVPSENSEFYRRSRLVQKSVLRRDPESL